MKAWNKPMMETLDLNMTAGGSLQPTSHDGVMYTIVKDGQEVLVEEFNKISGK